MRNVIETGQSDERAVGRLEAVLSAALELARAEQRKDSRSLMFIGAFGLSCDTGWPPTVDLCSLLDALIRSHERHRTGRELLIALANDNNLEHITHYIQNNLTNDEARIVYDHLRHHPEQI